MTLGVITVGVAVAASTMFYSDSTFYSATLLYSASTRLCYKTKIDNGERYAICRNRSYPCYFYLERDGCPCPDGQMSCQF